MIGILLALAAATGFAATRILVRFGTKDVNPLTGTVISLIFSSATVGVPVSMFYTSEFGNLPVAAYGWIALMAFIGYVTGRLLEFTAIRNIGVARTSPLGSTSPIFAVVLAILFLGESPNVAISAGTIGVVAGGALILVEGGAAGVVGQSPRVKVVGYACAITAAAGYAGLTVIAKHVVTNFGPAVLITFLSTLFGCIMLAPMAARDIPRVLHTAKKAVLMYAIAGAGTGAAVVSLFLSLERTDVVVAMPLVSSGPLFTLILAHIFLRRLEKLTLFVVSGTFLVVAGTILVVLGGAS